LRYVLGDHQGSTESFVENGTGTVTNTSFTAFGMRRDAATWSGEPGNRTALDEITRQGYTYQTVLGSMGLNHMNGRVHDATSGRFLSADPYVTAPGYTQNYNRYSYVYNNPLSYLDPSGFGGECAQVPDATAPGGIRNECPDIVAKPPGRPEDAPAYGYNRAVNQFGADTVRGYGHGPYGMAGLYEPIFVPEGTPTHGLPKYVYAQCAHLGCHGIDAVPAFMYWSNVEPSTTDKVLWLASAIPVTKLLQGLEMAMKARGIGKLGGIITSTTNSAGGTVVTASGSVVGSDFVGAVNSGLMRGGPVNILSGAHGEISGLMRAERAFLEGDKAAYGHLEGVNIFDVMRMSPGEISGVLQGPGTTIGAFCESGACLAPFR
jgi:RHS repeat-associated protein